MKMTIKTRSLLLGSCVAALCGLSQTASAHPGWVNPAVGSATASKYTSQFNAITVGHGCADGAGGYLGVKAASWLMPTGTTPGETAPFSIGCDAAGSNCTGVEGQASVAKLMNNSPGAQTNLTTGVTTFPKSLKATVATSLADEFTNVPTLAGRFKLNQNKGVFSTQRLKLDANGNPIGFYEKSGYVDPKAIAVTDMRMTTGGIVFKPGTCATQLIVRMAGADICKIDDKLTNEHNQNLWFGGPTNKLSTGHGVHENFWLAYTITRPAAETASCADAAKYSILVMPTNTEINNLAFPGWGNL
jgi:hypothetical protein